MIKENNVFDEEILPMTRKIRSADNDALFDGMLKAAGVNMSPEEKENLRNAHKALKTLAERARPQRKERSWEVRMAPFYTPKIPRKIAKK